MVIAAGAVEYCGGQNKDKAWLTKDGNACYRTVGNIYSYGGGPVSSGTNLGTIKASYTPGAGVNAHHTATIVVTITMQGSFPVAKQKRAVMQVIFGTARQVVLL